MFKFTRKVLVLTLTIILTLSLCACADSYGAATSTPLSSTSVFTGDVQTTSFNTEVGTSSLSVNEKETLASEPLSEEEKQKLINYITYVHDLMPYSYDWKDFKTISEIDKTMVLSGFGSVGKDKARTVTNNGGYNTNDKNVEVLNRVEYEKIIQDILNPDFTIGTNIPGDLIYPYYSKTNDAFNFSWGVGGAETAKLECEYVDGYKGNGEYHIILENYEYIYSPDPASMSGLMDKVYWNGEVIGKMVYSDTTNTATFNIEWYGEKPITEYVLKDNGKGAYYLVSKITRDAVASSRATAQVSSNTQTVNAYGAYYDILRSEIDKRGLVTEPQLQQMMPSTLSMFGFDTFEESVYYAALIDFDNNGIDELLYCYATPGDCPRYAIHTFNNGAAILLVDDTMDSSSGDPSFGIKIITGVNGVRYVETQHNNGSMQTSNEFSTLQNGNQWSQTVAFLYTFYDDVAEYSLNDNSITKNEYNTEMLKYNRSVSPVEFSEKSVTAVLNTLRSGSVENKTVPVSDYSSDYAAYLKSFLSDVGTNAAEYKFTIRDIDGNGADELLILHSIESASSGAGGISEELTFFAKGTDVVKIPFHTSEFENYKGEIQQYTPEQIDLSSLDSVYIVDNADIPGVFYTISGIGGGAVNYVTISDGKIEDKAVYGYTDGSPEYPDDASESVDDPALYAAYHSNSQEINWHLLNTETLMSIFNR